ncbi:MAG: ribose-phosphate diphosphokinase [Candidatus Poseidoniales archaeon]|nr:MAG: ribose-phosphate diphosphokinase [Candidatus Poseidoniales archaeon]
MVVVSGSNAGAMAQQLADALGWAHHPLETRRFPDTEGYIRIPTDSIEAIRSEPVVVVSNTFPDSGIVETMLMLDAVRDVRKGRLENLREIGPQTLPDAGKGVLLAIPYFGYSRQDKRFKPGESISALAIADLLATRCDGMVLLDLHAPAVLSDLSIPVAFTSAMPELADHLKETVNPDFILSPDKGAIDRASSVANQIGCEFSYLEKTRIDAHTIVHKAKDLDVEGKSVAIVDDMIATGGTICRAAEALRSQGAVQVHAACSHGLFTGGAIARLLRYVDGVHATGSLSNARDVISGGPALARGVHDVLAQLGLSS